VQLTAVLSVLDAMQAVGCRCWVGGGWGVDALVGRQTRAHRDLDLAFDASFEGPAVAALEALGYEIETDWRPVRVELVATGARWVDLHPVVLDDRDDGVQAGFDGAVFTYPASARVTGQLGGRPVPCLSIAKQLELHRGYVPRAVDLEDLALLLALTAGDGAEQDAADL
jgi:lincosamide nucleotidyltransferase A/C/D/E